MPKSTSSAWKYFEKIDSETARCNECSKIFKCKGGSTNGLNKHLKNVHDKLDEDPKRKAGDEPLNQPSVKKLIRKEKI